MKIKATIGEITAISRKSRDDGNQYWGRIPGTPYDRMAQDWVLSRFNTLDMKEQPSPSASLHRPGRKPQNYNLSGDVWV